MNSVTFLCLHIYHVFFVQAINFVQIEMTKPFLTLQRTAKVSFHTRWCGKVIRYLRKLSSPSHFHIGYIRESLFHVMMIIAFFLPSFSLSPRCLFITKHSTEKIEGKVWKMLTLYVNSVLITHIYSINLDITELCDVFFIEIWALKLSSSKQDMPHLLPYIKIFHQQIFYRNHAFIHHRFRRFGWHIHCVKHSDEYFMSNISRNIRSASLKSQ